MADKKKKSPGKIAMLNEAKKAEFVDKKMPPKIKKAGKALPAGKAGIGGGKLTHKFGKETGAKMPAKLMPKPKKKKAV